MEQCKATIYLIRCTSAAEHYHNDWCAKHTVQRRVSHNFYKDVEEEWERTKWSAFSDSGGPHGVVLWRGTRAKTIKTTSDSSGQTITLCEKTFSMEYGIVTKMSDGLVKEVIRDSISRVPVTGIPTSWTENEDTFLEGHTSELSQDDQMQTDHIQDKQDQQNQEHHSQEHHNQEHHNQDGHKQRLF
ncbi:hypothetical protein PGQ11_006296 [Apiospora arundinis]|uniref:Uncharacterized protein n=1 Tax=Apiospora arundinis TaxID=335852 RepID=A0ABR2ISA3_9PEZI